MLRVAFKVLRKVALWVFCRISWSEYKTVLILEFLASLYKIINILLLHTLFNVIGFQDDHCTLTSVVTLFLTPPVLLYTYFLLTYFTLINHSEEGNGFMR